MTPHHPQADPFTHAQWYALGRDKDFPNDRKTHTRLLSQDLIVVRKDHTLEVTLSQGQPRPIQHRYGHVWTTLSDTPRTLYDIPEFEETGRRLVTAGAIHVRCSGLRVVENFLDMAHFPFVHTGILGVEDHAEVQRYDVSMNVDQDEIWATNCKFFQPMAAAASKGGTITEYKYRLPHPHSVILYKTCPSRPGEWDLIGLFIQPTEKDACIVHSFVLVFDKNNSDTDLLHFQQNIFLQDRIILENQIPRQLPLDTRIEIPTRADASSIAFRRWLKANGVTWSTTQAENLE